MKGQKRFFPILALFVGVVLAVSLDFGIRQIYLKVWKKPFLDTHPLRQADENFHHGIKPNSEGVDTYGPYSAKYFSNSLGLRDEKIREVSMETNHPRILFIGDSFTEGGPIPWDKTFVGRVAEKLKSQNIEVLNAGVASYCPITERIKLRQLLGEKGLRVDRVVLCLDISDLKDIFYYEEDHSGKVREIPYGPFHDKAGRLRRADEVCGWLENHVEKNFVILGAIVRNVRLQWRRHASSTGVTEYDAIPDWAYDWPNYRGQYQDLVEKGLIKIKAEMTLLAQELKKLGVPLTLVVYPWPQQVKAGTKPSRSETEWASWAKENGVQFISLFPVFVNQEPAEEVIQKYYWKNDAHWNEEGHRMVAEALLRPEGGILLPKKGAGESKTQAGK
jgi:lysophospholipase L1-like esterase